MFLLLSDKTRCNDLTDFTAVLSRDICDGETVAVVARAIATAAK